MAAAGFDHVENARVLRGMSTIKGDYTSAATVLSPYRVHVAWSAGPKTRSYYTRWDKSSFIIIRIIFSPPYRYPGFTRRARPAVCWPWVAERKENSFQKSTPKPRFNTSTIVSLRGSITPRLFVCIIIIFFIFFYRKSLPPTSFPSAPSRMNDAARGCGSLAYYTWKAFRQFFDNKSTEQ